MPVEIVGRAIVRTVTAPRPPTNEVLGFPARAGAVIALFPARLRQKMFGG